MKNTGSNLTTKAGIILLLILLFPAVYFRIPGLEAFVLMMVLLCLVVWLWARYAASKLHLSIEEREVCVFPGQQIRLHVRLENRKFLPVIWLHLIFSGKNGDILQKTESGPAGALLTWIMPYQTLSWTLHLTGISRGIFILDHFTVCSGDGFGLSNQRKELIPEAPCSIVIYPKIIRADETVILQHMKELNAARTGLLSDRTLLRYTRPYTGRESYKDINWRSLAKGSEEQVNVFEQLDMRQVAFIPDLQSFVYTETVTDNDGEKIVRRLRQEDLERMLSLIASLIVRLTEREVRTAILLPGIAEHPPAICRPEDFRNQTGELLKMLAGIVYACEDTKLPLSLVALQSHQLGQIYVVTHSTKTGTIQLPKELGARYILNEMQQEAPDVIDRKRLETAI